MSIFLQESRHPVFELELLPVMVALFVWESQLQHCQSVFYLDNEATRGALILGSNPKLQWQLVGVNLHSERNAKPAESLVCKSSYKQ